MSMSRDDQEAVQQMTQSQPAVNFPNAPAGFLFLTVREAYEIFVTKSQLAVLMQGVQQRLDGVVSRAESELRWKMEDERFKRLEEQSSHVTDLLEDMKTNRLPKWVYPALAIAVPTIMSLLTIWASLRVVQ